MATKVEKIGSKRYDALRKKAEQGKFYTPEEAVALAKENATAKFDETIEVAVRLNLEAKHTIRDTISYPNSFGKEKRVLVFAKGAKAEEAKTAKADFVGSDDLVEKIKEGFLDFDVAIATPDIMKDLVKLGPILGRRGLMPNPKTGTVTLDIAQAVKSFKAGRLEYRANKEGIVHVAIGKASMTKEQLAENFYMLYDEILRKKPSDLKGDYIKSVAVTSTMGLGLKLDYRKIGKKE